MKITQKIISLLLAVIMLCSAMTGLSVITASAATTASGSSSGSNAAPGEEEDTLDYLTEIFATPEDKLATMQQMYAKGNYAIYADERSGEVAVKDLVTGQVMFTNPYDIAAAPSSDAIKAELMSQIIVTYIDNGKKKSAKVIGINKDDLTLCIETRDGRKINVSSPSTVIIPNKI